MERKISVLPWETLPTYHKVMVEKGLGRESDDVVVSLTAEGQKRFIVRIAIHKRMHELEIGWTGKVGT